LVSQGLEDRFDLKNVVRNFWDDALLSDQGIVIRQYVPLEKLEEGIK